MLRFNQTKNALSWKLSGQVFTCEPWGSVDIPDGLVQACVSMGLPLGVSATAPEQRAQERIEEEKRARENDAFAAVLRRAEAAEADAKAAKAELERLQVAMSDTRAAFVKLSTERDALAGELARTKADKDAAERLLSEQAQRAEDAEVKAQKAEALSAAKAEPKKKTG